MKQLDTDTTISLSLILSFYSHALDCWVPAIKYLSIWLSTYTILVPCLLLFPLSSFFFFNIHFSLLMDLGLLFVGWDLMGKRIGYLGWGRLGTGNGAEWVWYKCKGSVPLFDDRRLLCFSACNPSLPGGIWLGWTFLGDTGNLGSVCFAVWVVVYLFSWVRRICKWTGSGMKWKTAQNIRNNKVPVV